MKVCAIIVAGGKGRRMGADINKVFLPLCGKEILAHTLDAFERCADIDEVVVVTGSNDIRYANALIRREGITKVSVVVEGGLERQNSVYNGLCASSGDIAVIHDGARCLITPEEISASIQGAYKYGAAALGTAVKDTLKTIDSNGRITGTINRDRTVSIATPQTFPYNDIKELHQRAEKEGLSVTDDCAVFEHYGRHVHYINCSYENIKLTTPEDITLGEQILKRRESK